MDKMNDFDEFDETFEIGEIDENDPAIKENREFLEKLRKELPPEELEEFSIELFLALQIFFKGRIQRKHNVIEYRVTKGPKFRITTELIK